MTCVGCLLAPPNRLALLNEGTHPLLGVAGTQCRDDGRKPCRLSLLRRKVGGAPRDLRARSQRPGVFLVYLLAPVLGAVLGGGSYLGLLRPALPAHAPAQVVPVEGPPGSTLGEPAGDGARSLVQE